LDADSAWRGWNGHEISFGVHRDAETYNQIKNNLTDWIVGASGGVASSARGRTATNAAWAQDIWSLTPQLKAALGGRDEDRRAYDGANFSASPTLNVNQAKISAKAFSPKATMSWQASDPWRLTLSYGQAFRMPTVTELYQTIATGATLSVPNPNLKPEHSKDY